MSDNEVVQISRGKVRGALEAAMRGAMAGEISRQVHEQIGSSVAFRSNVVNLEAAWNEDGITLDGYDIEWID